MLRALLLVVTVLSGLASPAAHARSRVDYGAFATSCPGVVAASQQDPDAGASGTGGDVPAGIEVIRGMGAYDRQEATERNSGVQGDDRVGRRLAAELGERTRRYTWSLGAGAAGLLCLAGCAGLLMHTRDRRGPASPEPALPG